VVASIGQSTENIVDGPPGDDAIAVAFGEMTLEPSMTKRKAISLLARRHGMAANDVYAALERAKKSIK
jgi:ABC-type Na+ transport system ATPase subunit NatA